MNKIEFQSVSFGYSQTKKGAIVKDTSLTFSSDKISVITGPSGCGKSTILSLAAGIYPKHEGEYKTGNILIDGQNISQLSPEKRSSLVGMMFQNPNLQFCMDTVANEILFCLGNIQMPKDKMAERMASALEFCEIRHLKDRLLQSLSGGEKQKAMLACLVAIRPKWLLLDEPFANIDGRSAEKIIEKIRQLNKWGMGVLVVDHRLDIWLPIADEIRLMNREHGITNERFQPNQLSDRQLEMMGILPPNRHYQKPDSFKEQDENQSVLRLRNLTISRGQQPILKQINADFKRQKIYAIIGDSGSGKSTLFGAINGLYKYKGEIFLDDKKIRKRIRRQVGALGFALQSPQDQFIANTVLDEITIGLSYRINKNKIDQEAERILRAIDLWGYRNFSPYLLSQGQQRRLGIAALLTYDCEVLICDEPTYAQDWQNTEMIMLSLIRKIRERNMTLIFSTHDHKLAADYADVILTLEDGRLYEYTKSSL